MTSRMIINLRRESVPRLSAETRELITATTRDRAFECASSLLREEGWKRFTMEKLARRMGVSKGTLYNYFKDKEAVIFFIRDAISLCVAEKIHQEMVQEPDTRKLLQMIVLRSLEGMKEYRFLQLALGSIMIRRQSEKAEGSSESLPEDSSTDHIYHALVDVLKRGMEDGSVRSGDPYVMAAVLNAALVGVDMGERFYRDVDMGSSDARQEIVTTLLQGLCKEEQ